MNREVRQALEDMARALVDFAKTVAATPKHPLEALSDDARLDKRAEAVANREEQEIRDPGIH